jgi:uncharacterized membrane-anchored protein YitT (DUF2179 family)
MIIRPFFRLLPSPVFFGIRVFTGQGDYTAERDDLLVNITLDELITHVQEIDKQAS